MAFRDSRNYTKFVRTIAAAAAAGDPSAEYFTAIALKYCGANLELYFRQSDGSFRTLDEAQVRFGILPASVLDEIVDTYDRCHEYMIDPGEKDPTSAWKSWLDRASAAGYPPAESLEADVLREAALMRDSANTSGGNVVPPTMGPARDLAMRAVMSGDPASILEMSNWVDGAKHSLANSEDLVAAWQLLACRRGFDDCGSNSELLRASCNVDPQCADDSSVVDSLKRVFGTRFEDIQNLANAIGLAIDQKNPKAVESYL